MQTVIIVIHLMIVAAMIGVVLLQKSEGGGLGIGSTRRLHVEPRHRQRAHPDDRDPGRGFFATSLVLSILAGMDRKPRSIIQNTGAPAPAGAGAPARQGGGVLDTLRQQEQPPAPPPGPQVPRSQ